MVSYETDLWKLLSPNHLIISETVMTISSTIGRRIELDRRMGNGSQLLLPQAQILVPLAEIKVFVLSELAQED